MTILQYSKGGVKGHVRNGDHHHHHNVYRSSSTAASQVGTKVTFRGGGRRQQQQRRPSTLSSWSGTSTSSKHHPHQQSYGRHHHNTYRSGVGGAAANSSGGGSIAIDGMVTSGIVANKNSINNGSGNGNTKWVRQPSTTASAALIATQHQEKPLSVSVLDADDDVRLDDGEDGYSNINHNEDDDDDDDVVVVSTKNHNQHKEEAEDSSSAIRLDCSSLASSSMMIAPNVENADFTTQDLNHRNIAQQQKQKSQHGLSKLGRNKLVLQKQQQQQQHMARSFDEQHSQRVNKIAPNKLVSTSAAAAVRTVPGSSTSLSSYSSLRFSRHRQNQQQVQQKKPPVANYSIRRGLSSSPVPPPAPVVASLGGRKLEVMHRRGGGGQSSFLRGGGGRRCRSRSASPLPNHTLPSPKRIRIDAVTSSESSKILQQKRSEDEQSDAANDDDDEEEVSDSRGGMDDQTSSLDQGKDSIVMKNKVLTDFAYQETFCVPLGGKPPSTNNNSHKTRRHGGRRHGRSIPHRNTGLVRVPVDEDNTRVCTWFARGMECTDVRCKYRHDVPLDSTIPLCSYFQQHGMCLRQMDGKCPFRHVKVDSTATPCPNFDRLGFCLDPTCTRMHRKKTKSNNNSNEDNILDEDDKDENDNNNTTKKMMKTKNRSLTLSSKTMLSLQEGMRCKMGGGIEHDSSGGGGGDVVVVINNNDEQKQQQQQRGVSVVSVLQQPSSDDDYDEEEDFIPIPMI